MGGAAVHGLHRPELNAADARLARNKDHSACNRARSP
jgi:hypothetical protein